MRHNYAGDRLRLHGKDGTRAAVFAPLDFIARPAALVPGPGPDPAAEPAPAARAGAPLARSLRRKSAEEVS